MKNKTSNNTATAPLKGRTVWAVVTADPRSYEIGYLAYTSIFADRESARKCLRNSAAEDAECFDSEIVWHEKGTDEEWCEIHSGGEVRTVHQLERHFIK